MRHQFLITFLLVLAILSLGFSCHKTDTSVTGGKGGNAVLTITPIHLYLNVDSCTIYVKYAATDAPANNVYDDSQVVHIVDTTPVTVFSGLKKGQYYIFGDGYHRFYKTCVKGGIPISISVEDTNSVLLPTSAYQK